MIERPQAARGQIIPNAAITEIDLVDGQFNIYNNAGSTHLVIDVVGSFYFLFAPTSLGAPGASARNFTRPAPRSFTLRKVT